MKKSLSELIDGLIIVNLKIFHIVEKIQKNEHTKEDAKKAQDLNGLRSEYLNALNEFFNERKEIKL